MKLSVLVVLDGHKGDQWTGIDLGVLPSKFEHEIVVILNGPQPAESTIPPQIRVVHLDAYRTKAEAINLAAETCESELLLFLSHPRCNVVGLDSALLNLKQNSRISGFVAMLTHNGVLVNSSGYVLSDGQLIWPEMFTSLRHILLGNFEWNEIGNSLGMLIRKNDFLKIGGYSGKYSSQLYEDADLAQRLRATGHKLPFTPTLQVELLGRNKSEIYSLMRSVSPLDQVRLAQRLQSLTSTNPPARSSVDTQLNNSYDFTGLKVGIHTPFAISPGGGERYLFTLMRGLERQGAEVELVLPRPYSVDVLASTFSSLGLPNNPIPTRLLHEIEATEYDVFVSMGNDLSPQTEGHGKVNIFHCQFPFPTKERGKKKHRLEDYPVIVANSDFTKKRIEILLKPRNKKNIRVIYPPVPEITRTDERKDPFKIVSVGRFFTGDHSKQQDLLIKAFKELYAFDPRYKLVLLGSIAPGQIHDDYVSGCLAYARGLPVTFHFDASQELIRESYLTSAIYWHAAGLGIDTDLFPERTEHFGISIVEAMSSGTIPFVVNSGGPLEVVAPQINGFLYSNIHELVKLTLSLQKRSIGEIENIRSQAQKTAEQFSEFIFIEEFSKLIHETVVTHSMK